MAYKTPLLLTCMFLVATACGGSSDSPPAPLSRHFDDMFIAQVPLDQKQSVVQAQNDYAVAKMERAKADADLSEANATFEIAKNERKSAGNTLDSALTAKKQADESADQNRVNDAARLLRGAELAQKAADKRVKYIEAYRNWLKKHQRYTEENMYWREAQFEKSKAEVAQRNNISPKDFTFSDYPKQEEERQKRTAKAKEAAAREREKANSARQQWLQQQAAADEANGRASDLPDPMAKLSGTSSLGAPAARGRVSRTSWS
ncbi:MAG: hypothetical protein R3B48_09240 [Kofleriaceae bacterium]